MEFVPIVEVDMKEARSAEESRGIDTARHAPSTIHAGALPVVRLRAMQAFTSLAQALLPPTATAVALAEARSARKPSAVWVSSSSDTSRDASSSSAALTLDALTRATLTCSATSACCQK